MASSAKHNRVKLHPGMAVGDLLKFHSDRDIFDGNNFDTNGFAALDGRIKTVELKLARHPLFAKISRHAV